MDIVINGKKKSSNGKGYNAYFNSVVAIVLSRYMESKSKYSPDFLVLDSPILSRKEKETKKPSETMRNTLFENIVCGIQAISLGKKPGFRWISDASVRWIRCGSGTTIRTI